MSTEKIAALEAQVEQLTAANAALTAEVSAFRAAAKEVRASAVKSLFADLGIEFSDGAAAPYLEMSDSTFSAVSAHMKSGRKSVPAHLFSEQATQGSAPAGEKSILIADAERRAGKSK